LLAPLAKLFPHFQNRGAAPENTCIGDDTKGAARRSQGKQTIRLMERRCLSHYRNSVKKTASPRKNSLKSGNRQLSYGQKCLLKRWTFAILNFKNFRIRLSGCHRVPNVLSFTKFHRNRMISVEIWRFNDLQYSGHRPC